MIADVRLKVRLRVRALFAKISSGTTDAIIAEDTFSSIPVPCGHPADGRCVLAHVIARELPGTQVRVYRHTVEIDLPLAYKGSQRSISEPLTPGVGLFVTKCTTANGHNGNRFSSCVAKGMPSLPSTKTRQRGGR
jgi:hypothetical protein